MGLPLGSRGNENRRVEPDFEKTVKKKERLLRVVGLVVIAAAMAMFAGIEGVGSRLQRIPNALRFLFSSFDVSLLSIPLVL